MLVLAGQRETAAGFLKNQKQFYFKKTFLSVFQFSFQQTNFFLITDTLLLVQRIPDYAEEETEWFEAQIEDLDPKNSDSFRWKVSALRPFTTYHFKIVLNFSSDLQGIETQPSLPIRTKADPDVAPSKPILYEIEQVNFFCQNGASIVTFYTCFLCEGIFP